MFYTYSTITLSFMAAGCGDGTIRIFHASTGRLAYNLQSSSSQVYFPRIIRYKYIFTLVSFCNKSGTF